jgi:hypothetical protein
MWHRGHMQVSFNQLALVPERDAGALTARQFHEEIVEAGQPVVLRGLVAQWPVVAAATSSPGQFADYLLGYDSGLDMRAMIAPPAARGRFFYNQDVTGFNFRTEPIKLAGALDLLLRGASGEVGPALAIQSVQVWQHLPGFDLANPLSLLPPSVEPRAWIGNRVTVAAHHDPSENIACVVAGRRRFTLFPPEQVANLYPGPFELTPAGPTISMVDFDELDRVRFPNFAKAERAALIADLKPGDAIFIPYLWWHHVRSTEALNMLVNYWWSPPTGATGFPLEALLHAMIAVRDLPPRHRRAWGAMFDHYVFNPETAGAHLPPQRRGIQASPPSPETLAQARELLARALGRSS